MGKMTAASSGKAVKRTPASTKRATAKAKKSTGAKKTPIVTSPERVVINKKKASSSASSAAAQAKKGAAAKKKKASSAPPPPPPPMPEGWPVSSEPSYPAPRAAVMAEDAPTKEAAAKEKDIMDFELESLHSDATDDHGVGSPTKRTVTKFTPANYLTPGNLLQQSCNGSDVFLRKRAVHSASMVFPSVAPGGDYSGAATNKGGPTRFLIIFPGRMSLKVPPPPSKPSAANGAVGDDDGKDGDNDELNEGDEKEGEKEDNGEKMAKKRNPFAPTNPPQMLGKLVSLGGDDRRLELRIPFPSPGGDSAPGVAPDGNEQKKIVMSGRAVPLSGEYMALTFRRTGGTKDFSSSSTPKNKKKGTGSIMCKDVFRSVVVFGESKMLDDSGKVVPTKPVTVEAFAADKRGGGGGNDDNDGEGEKVAMKHYGGSERGLDGGGKYLGGATGGRKSWKEGAVAASRESIDSASSKELDMESGASEEDDDVVDKRGSGEGSDGEFLPAVAKKKRGKTSVAKRPSSSGTKQKAKDDSDADKVVEEVAPARKRTPRRSAANANNVSYVDGDSDVDMLDLSDSDEDEKSVDSDEGSEEEEEGVFKPKGKAKVKKPIVKAAIKRAAKTSKDSVANARKGSASKKIVDISVNLSSDEDDETESVESQFSEEEKHLKRKGKTKKPAAKAATKRAAKSKKASTASSKKESVSVKKLSSDEDEDGKSDDGSRFSDGEFAPKAKGTAKKPVAKTKKSLTASAKKASKEVLEVDESDSEKNDEEEKAVSKRKILAKKPAKIKKGSTESSERGCDSKKVFGVDESEREKGKEEEEAALKEKASAKKTTAKAAVETAAETEDVPAKRTPRRSAARAPNVSSVDEDSNTDMVKIDGKEGEDHHENGDDEEEGVSELKGKKKGGKPVTKAATETAACVTKRSAGASKKRNTFASEENASGNEEESREGSKVCKEEEEDPPKGRATAKKSTATDAATKTAAKTSKGSTASARKECASKKVHNNSNGHENEGSEESSRISDGEEWNECPVTRKKQGKAAGAISGRQSAGVKRKAKNESDEDNVEEVTEPPITRKRTPRRNATNVSYADEDSDVDMVNLSDSGEGEENDNETKGKQKTRRKPAIKAVTKGATKRNKSSTVSSKKKRTLKKNESSDEAAESNEIETLSDGERGLKLKGKPKVKRHPAKAAAKRKAKDKVTVSKKKSAADENMESNESSKLGDEEEDVKPKGKPKAKKITAEKDATKMVATKATALKTTDKGPSTPPRKRTKKSAGVAKKASDVIKIDSDSSDVSKPTSKVVMKNPSPAMSSLSKSPISRGRRKKNSPDRRKSPGKENDLNWDDDPYNFL